MVGEIEQPNSTVTSTREQQRDTLSVERVALVAHYAISKSPPHSLGQVKLNHILWHVDLEHHRRFGISMTGLKEYVRGPHGPLSWSIVAAVSWLVRQGRVINNRNVSDGFAGAESANLQSLADPAGLTLEQVGIIDKVVQALALLTARQRMSMVHADPLWQEIKSSGSMVISTGAIVTRGRAVPREPCPCATSSQQ